MPNPFKSRKLRLVPWGILMGMAMWVVCWGVVYATADPDAISIGEVYVFRDVIEDGDQLWFVRYDIEYASEPDEDAEDTFMLAIYDTDGSTLLYTKAVNYYQLNMISRYLTAEEALTWNGEYWVRIMGNPAFFDPLTEGTNMRSRQLGAGDYYEGAELGERMLQQAALFEVDWALDLLTSAGYLNATGSFYFVKAIPQLPNMAPEIFYQITYDPDTGRTDFNVTYMEELSEHQGTKLQTAIQDLATTFHVTEDWMAIFLVGVAYLTVGGSIYAVTRDPGISMLASIPVLVGAAWMGVGTSIMTIVVVCMIIAGILFAIHFILQRWA